MVTRERRMNLTLQQEQSKSDMLFIRIEPELKRDFEFYAKQAGVTTSSALRQLIATFVREQKKAK